MNKFLLAASCLLLASTFSGCGNLSPRDNLSPQLMQQIDKLQGNQNTLENNQNALKLEIGRLQQALTMQNSNNNQIQQGWLNVQSDGIIIGIFSVLIIGMMMYYMWQSSHYEKAAEILGEQVKESTDDDLKERVMAAAWNTNVEKTVFKFIS